MTEAASSGASKNSLLAVDVEGLLAKAFDGMDAALLQTVEANRKALNQFVAQGVDVQDKQMKAALANLEKMEDMFFDTVTKAAAGTGQPMQGPWEQVLGAMKNKGTATGAEATKAVEQLVAQAQSTLRNSRALSLKTTQALMGSYSTLVSGVLIGMSDGLRSRAEAPKATTPRAARKT